MADQQQQEFAENGRELGRDVGAFSRDDPEAAEQVIAENAVCFGGLREHADASGGFVFDVDVHQGAKPVLIVLLAEHQRHHVVVEHDRSEPGNIRQIKDLTRGDGDRLRDIRRRGPFVRRQRETELHLVEGIHADARRVRPGVSQRTPNGLPRRDDRAEILAAAVVFAVLLVVFVHRDVRHDSVDRAARDAEIGLLRTGVFDVDPHDGLRLKVRGVDIQPRGCHLHAVLIKDHAPLRREGACSLHRRRGFLTGRDGLDCAFRRGIRRFRWFLLQSAGPAA